MNQDSYKDMRLYARFELGETALLKSESNDGGFDIEIVDIGLGGVQLRSDKKLPVEVPTTIHIQRDPKTLLVLHGHVRYSNLCDGEKVYVSGYKFSPENMQERVIIAEFVREVFENQWQELAS